MSTGKEDGLLRGDLVRELVFGASTDDAVDAAADQFCRSHLGYPVEEVLFRRTSVGVVVGVRLTDGRRVVVKAHQPRQSRVTLAAVHRIQQHLYREGFPCPRPLLAATPLADGLATVEELVDAGEFRDTHDPIFRRLMAEALARQVELARACGLPDALGRGWDPYAEDRLWPREGHSPIFDFQATAEGAEWIDAIAANVKLRIAPRTGGDSIVGHMDWSGKHFRFAGERVSVVYDWDSLRVRAEPAIVGVAAMTFTANFDLPNVRLTPEPDEVRAFVDDYSELRARPLTRREREQAAAWATFIAAYLARCEHALHRSGEDPNNFSAALRRHGEEYLHP